MDTLQEIDETFNSPEYIAQSLHDFKNKNWNGKRFPDLVNYFRSTFKAVPFHLINIKKGTVLFRGRKNDQFKYPIFNNLEEISIRSDDKVDTFGRANIPKQSVFYCSTDEVSVVREVTQWYVNDTGRAQDLHTKGTVDMSWSPFTCMMTISAWVVNEDLQLALLFSSMDKQRSLEIQKCAKERLTIGPEGSEANNKSSNLIVDFFSNEFAKNDVKHHLEYIYSAYYAFEVFHEHGLNNQGTKYDGVQYVSVANDYNGENIALSRNALEKKIQFLGANFCCTFNSYEKKLDGDKNAIIGRDKAAKIRSDNTFEWIDHAGGFDYLTKSGDQFKHIMLPSDGSKFSKDMVRITG